MLSIIPVLITAITVGMAVNYLADVLPTRRKLTAPFCQQCGTQLDSLNYFLWPRRCPNCQQRRTIRTWIVEFIMVMIGIWLWMQPIIEINPLLTVLLIAYFMLVIVVDLEHRLILHPVSVAGGVLCIVIGIQLHGFLPTIFGGAAGTAIMFGLYMLGRVFVRYLSKTRGEEVGEDALGFGDVILGGVLGLLLGWPGIIAGLILAVILAGIISLLYLAVMFVSRRDLRNLTIAYGPYLVVSAFLLVFVL